MTFPEPDSTLDGIAALERIEVEFAAVEGALVRLDTGTYGRCEVCEAPIADDVLAADPVARLCSGHLDVLGANAGAGGVDHGSDRQPSPPPAPGAA